MNSYRDYTDSFPERRVNGGRQWIGWPDSVPSEAERVGERTDLSELKQRIDDGIAIPIVTVNGTPQKWLVLVRKKGKEFLATDGYGKIHGTHATKRKAMENVDAINRSDPRFAALFGIRSR